MKIPWRTLKIITEIKKIEFFVTVITRKLEKNLKTWRITLKKDSEKNWRRNHKYIEKYVKPGCYMAYMDYTLVWYAGIYYIYWQSRFYFQEMNLNTVFSPVSTLPPIFSNDKKLEPNTVMAKLYSRLSASTKRVCIKYRSSKAAIIKRKTNRKNSEETQKDSVS